MFAVIKAGGKQYGVAAEDVIRIDGIDRNPGDIVEFGEVLMLGGDKLQVGAPTISGALVAGEVLEHARGDKVIAFKKRRRKNSRRRHGHRQDFTLVRITEILTGGKQPSKEAKPRPQKAKAAKAEGETKPAAKAKIEAPKAKAAKGAKGKSKKK